MKFLFISKTDKNRWRRSWVILFSKLCLYWQTYRQASKRWYFIFQDFYLIIFLNHFWPHIFILNFTRIFLIWQQFKCSFIGYQKAKRSKSDDRAIKGLWNRADGYMNTCILYFLLHHVFYFGNVSMYFLFNPLSFPLPASTTTKRQLPIELNIMVFVCCGRDVLLELLVDKLQLIADSRFL